MHYHVQASDGPSALPDWISLSASCKLVCDWYRYCVASSTPVQSISHLKDICTQVFMSQEFWLSFLWASRQSTSFTPCCGGFVSAFFAASLPTLALVVPSCSCRASACSVAGFCLFLASDLPAGGAPDLRLLLAMIPGNSWSAGYWDGLAAGKTNNPRLRALCCYHLNGDSRAPCVALLVLRTSVIATALLVTIASFAVHAVVSHHLILTPHQHHPDKILPSRRIRAHSLLGRAAYHRLCLQSYSSETRCEAAAPRALPTHAFARGTSTSV